MSAYIIPLLLALALRVTCLNWELRRPPGLAVISGLWLGLSAWILGALLNAWVPVWEMALTGIIVTVCVNLGRDENAVNLKPLTDTLAVLTLGVLSVLPVDWAEVAAAAVSLALIGYVIDRLTTPLPHRLRIMLQVAPIFLLALLASQISQVGDFGSRLFLRDRLFPLRLAFAAPLLGEPLLLPSGSAAWLTRNPDSSVHRMAVLLHGADRAGSKQPAAVALRGALIKAGYSVLSVDTAGFGSTPPPRASATLDVWDPTIGPKEAFEYLHKSTKDGPIVPLLVGHSMGVEVALLMLRDGITSNGIYLFGGSASSSTMTEEAWVRDFKGMRGISCCLTLDAVRHIRAKFFSSENVADELPSSHSPIHFVEFDIEYPDVAKDRLPLYAALSSPKLNCMMARTTHYMNALSLKPFVLIDTGAITRAAHLLQSINTVAPQAIKC